MKSVFVRPWYPVAAFVLLACTGCGAKANPDQPTSNEPSGDAPSSNEPSPNTPSTNESSTNEPRCDGTSSNETSTGGSRKTDGFQPVTTAQPTEGGAWVVDPNAPLTLYALGRRSLRSRDGGHTWSALDWPAGAVSLLFARTPAPALYLQVADTKSPLESKLFKSSDAGITWTVASASAGGDVLVVDRDSGPVLVTVEGDRVSTSINDGSTWVDSALPPELQAPAFVKLGRAHVSNGPSPVLYVEAAGFDSAVESLVLVSTDAGATFVAKSVPGEPSASFAPPDLSLDCHGRLYFLAGQTVYRSSDTGTTWQSVATLDSVAYNFRVMQGAPSACSDSVYASGYAGVETLWHLDAGGTLTSQALPEGGSLSDLGSDRLLLVSTFDLRQRSDDGGRSWWTAGVSLALGNLAFSPARKGVLFVSTVTGVYRSEDGGKTWQPNAQKSGRFIQDLYPDRHDPTFLYAGSAGSEISSPTLISTDGGASFSDWPVPNQANPEQLEAIASPSICSGEVTVVTEKGVYTTPDAGRHFLPLLSMPPEQSILRAAIGTSEPKGIYAYVAAPDTGVNEILASVDGGATWVSADPGSYVDCLVVHPADPNTAFACTSAGNSRLLRTADGGRTWLPLAEPEDETYTLLRIDPSPPYALYALGTRLYRSNDQGSTWQRLTDSPPDSYDFEIDPHPGGARYALGESGILYEMFE